MSTYHDMYCVCPRSIIGFFFGKDDRLWKYYDLETAVTVANAPGRSNRSAQSAVAKSMASVPSVMYLPGHTACLRTQNTLLHIKRSSASVLLALRPAFKYLPRSNHAFHAHRILCPGRN